MKWRGTIRYNVTVMRISPVIYNKYTAISAESVIYKIFMFDDHGSTARASKASDENTDGEI